MFSFNLLSLQFACPLSWWILYVPFILLLFTVLLFTFYICIFLFEGSDTSLSDWLPRSPVTVTRLLFSQNKIVLFDPHSLTWNNTSNHLSYFMWKLTIATIFSDFFDFVSNLGNEVDFPHNQASTFLTSNNFDSGSLIWLRLRRKFVFLSFSAVAVFC